MRKWIFIDLCLFLMLGVFALAFAPDTFSLIIIVIMLTVASLAFARGIWGVLNIADGFRTGSDYIDGIKGIASASKWNTFKQSDIVFHNKLLDKLIAEYRSLVDEELNEDMLSAEIEQVINDDVLALHTWKTVMLQIPGTLTALGLIGTFLGLILGIGGIAFSSVDAAIGSITLLLSGIETAFYTSIVGVIFSMVFNICYKFAWNTLLRELGIFTAEFHKYIFPDGESRRNQFERDSIRQILECLQRIPKTGEYFYNTAQYGTLTAPNENALMTEIWDGLKNEDFIFYIQPRCDLNNKEIIGGEALMRWNHSRLGIVSPTVFLSVLEKNGYIVKLDCNMWEQVCKTLRAWIDCGLRPVPISVNISKMDILVIDVAEFFVDMVSKYRLPPQYLQMEIAENAYTQCFEAAAAAEEKLRRAGFYVVLNGAKGEYDTISLMEQTNADALRMDYSVLEAKSSSNPEAFAEIVEQGRRTRTRLIASGVENIRQLNILRKAGFAECQGFLLYKPVDTKSFEELLKKRI